MHENSNKNDNSSRRLEIREHAKRFVGTPLRNKDFHYNIYLSGARIKEFLNQPHKHFNEKNELLINIDKVIQEAKYIGQLSKKIESQNYDSQIFEITLVGDKTWIIVNFYTDNRCYLHSISDSKNILKFLIKTHHSLARTAIRHK